MTVRRGRTTASIAGVAAITVALLTACTRPAPAPSSSPSERVTASSAQQTAPSPSPTVTETATYFRDDEIAPWGVTLVPGQSLLGHLTNIGYPVQLPRDGGPIEYAEGTAITDGGKVVAYRVAPGDIYDFIARRFHLTNDGYLIVLNEVRRGEAAPLYAGDQLNLSASTLHRYGTVNGRIVHGPEPLEAPPQEP